MAKRDIVVGSRVKYKVNFLRSISCYTGPMPFARGRVTQIKEIGVKIASIDWDGPTPDVPDRVNVANLAHADDPEMT